MIVVSLVLILGSGGLLVAGILQASDPFVFASVGVSVLAAGALFLGLRHQRTVLPSLAGGHVDPGDTPGEQRDSRQFPPGERVTTGGAPRGGRSAFEESATVVLDLGTVADQRSTRTSMGEPATDPEEHTTDPPGEPPAELLLSSEESRLARRNDEVLVVDGRPRYHLKGCPHLAEKEFQPLPLSEATELGFTPCSRCAAATTLLG